MSEWLVARAYAEGFYQYAKTVSALTEWQGFLRNMALFMTDDSFSQAIKDPLLHQEDKLSLVHACAGKSVTKEMDQAVALLIDTKRLDYLSAISQVFDRCMARESKQVTAQLAYVHKPSEAVVTAIHQWLLKKTKRDVHIDMVEDKSLIGGFKVSYDDFVWDESVRSSVKRFAVDLKTMTTMF